MKKDFIENNQVELAGEITSGFQYNHEVYGEGFYMASLTVIRDSGTPDVLPVMVSERLVDVSVDWTGIKVRIAGQFRSYNKHDGEKKRLVLSVFAREFEQVEEGDMLFENGINKVFLDGFICKKPLYRRTPLGRDICDILLAVNRPYGKSDYIPLILWGRNARFANIYEVGTHIKVSGRIQSREYEKKISDTEAIKRTVYEVSVHKLEAANEQ